MAAQGADAVEGAAAYPGWRVVGACFLMAVFSWAVGFYGQGVFLARLREAHGWPISQVSAATTFYYLLSAALGAFLGDAIARFGSRAVLAGGMLVLGLATVLLGRVDTVPALYATYAVMAAGWAATNVVAVTATVGRWFDRKRGLAISLALNGASVGGIVGAPALAAAIGRYGFADALLYAGLVMAFGLAPLLALLIRERPPAKRDASAPPGAAAAVIPRGRALRSVRFWAVTGPFAAAFFVQVGFIVHQFALIEGASDARTAGFAVGLTAAMAVLGRVSLGLVIDRIDQRRATAASLGSQALALAAMAGMSGGAPLVLASALFGLSVGNVITLPALIIHREFEAASFARVVALSTAMGQLIYAFGPGAVGWLRDAFGGYGAPLLLCAAIDAAAAVAILSGRKRGEA